MKHRKIFFSILLLVVLLFTGCGSTTTKIKYDLTDTSSGVTQVVGTDLSTNTYQSKYKDSTFKVRGKHYSAGEDYHYMVVNDGVCCDFEIEIRLSDKKLKYPDTDKYIVIIAKYSYIPKTSTTSSSYYFSVLDFV